MAEEDAMKVEGDEKVEAVPRFEIKST